jgi:hypothetical protein
VGNLTIDDTLTQSDLFHIATEFKGLPSSHLITETLPTTSYTTDGGAAVLLQANPYASNMIKAFNQIGVPQPKPKPKTTTTSAPTLPASQVDVEVLNASLVDGIAHATGAALTTQGFDVTEIGDAPSLLTSGDPSQISYGPTGLEAAHTLGAVLSGPVSYVPDPSLSGNTVQLLIAGSQLSVNTPNSTSTTTTTVPGATTTTTTIPSDVYTNTQAEPWNPTPCTLASGAPTAGKVAKPGKEPPKTTTTAKAKT